MAVVPQHVLFDNSALNYISGQPQHGSQLADGDRGLVIEVVRASVAAGHAVAIVNLAALGELAGLHFKDPVRFALVWNFLFKSWAVRVLRPTFDAKVQPLRIKMELDAKGKVPMAQAFYSGVE